MKKMTLNIELFLQMNVLYITPKINIQGGINMETKIKLLIKQHKKKLKLDLYVQQISMGLSEENLQKEIQ